MSDQSRRFWRVGELSGATGLTVRTFHHYNQIGLLTPSQRTAGGHRLYSTEDVGRLSLIVILRRAGMSLKEIKDLICQESLDVAELIERQAEDLESALIETMAFGRRLRQTTGDALIQDPRQIRELVNWRPFSYITSQPIVLLVYADVERAHRKLIEMFGFGPGEISRQPDGTAAYAEVTGPTGNIRLHGPRPGLSTPDPDADPSQMTVVGVADVDAHFNRSQQAGAEIVKPVTTVFGMREYTTFDHEHHLWCFQQPG